MTEDPYEEAQKELEGELIKLVAQTSPGGLPDFLEAVANAVAARAEWYSTLTFTHAVEGKSVVLDYSGKASRWKWVARELRKLARDPHTLKS